MEKRKDPPKPEIIFERYAESFFDGETSPWIKRRHAKARSISKTTVNLRAAHIVNYLGPAFRGRDYMNLTL